MANTNETINITFTGSSASLQQAAQQVTQALQNVQQNTKAMSATTVAAGVAMGQVMADMGKKVLHFAKEAASSFSNVAKETRRMQGIMGGTAEDVSRLRFAADEMGASSTGLSRGFSILSQHLVKNDAVAKQLGVAYKTAAGEMRSPLDIMGEVADRLNEMGKGAERTALAKQALGRGFMELNPLLARGSEGMKEFAHEADVLGLTMSDKDLKAARELSLATKTLHAFVEGIWVSIGRNVVPTLAAYAKASADAAIKVREFFNEHKGLQTALKVTLAVVGAVVSAFVVYNGVMAITAAWPKIVAASQAFLTGVQILAIGVTEGLTGAMAALNLVLNLNPAVAIATGIVMLITAFIAALKASETFRNIFSRTMQIVGSVVGYVVYGIIKSFKFVVDAMTFVIRGAAKMASWFGKTFHIGWLKSAGDGVEGFIKTIDHGLNVAADAAKNNGGKIGRSIGEGIGNAIKGIKLPSFKMPKVDDVPKPGGVGGGGGEGAGGGADKAAAAAKAYWEKRINTAKEAFDIAKKAAEDAKKKMSDYSKEVADTVRGALDINALTESSFAKYLGANALVAAFRKKMSDTREFVNDLKALREQGLPVPMLQQIAAAGVDGGLAAARLLVGNAGAIEQLKSIQSEIDAAASEAGETLSGAVYGQEVAGAVGAVAPARATLTAEEKAARDAGMTVTEETSASGDITISVDVATDADPQDIADAVAFGLKTGTKPVVKTKPKKTPAGSSIKKSTGSGIRLTYR